MLLFGTSFFVFEVTFSFKLAIPPTKFILVSKKQELQANIVINKIYNLYNWYIYRKRNRNIYWFDKHKFLEQLKKKQQQNTFKESREIEIEANFFFFHLHRLNISNIHSSIVSFKNSMNSFHLWYDEISLYIYLIKASS